MAGPPSQPPARGGMSLYANLLDTDGSASISRGPVLFKDDKDDTSAKKAIDPALRFQPIRRPQIKPATKPKAAFPKAPPAAAIPSSAPAPTAAAATTTAPPTAPPTAPAPAAQPRNTLADWAAAEEDDFLYHGAAANEKRQRGGRRKKKNKRDDIPRETDWDELYDPARPTNVEEYLRSEERVREVRDWKAVLYAHRRGERGGSEEEDEDGDGDGEGGGRGRENQFAPPAAFSFAPPPMSPPRAAASSSAPIPHDTTGDDAYARRLALSGRAPPPPAAAAAAPPPPPPPPPPTDATTISRAPVRYSPPPPNPPAPDEMDLDTYDPEVDYTAIPLPPPNPTPPQPSQPPQSQQQEEKEEQERTLLPGQKNFAQRLMAKYGWTKGTGLGATESGITSALRVHVEKRRRKPDAEGGGFEGPGGRGRVIAPRQGKPNPRLTSAPTSTGGGVVEGAGAGEGRFGKSSVVVVLDGMLDNLAELEAEVEAGLGQEIGEECGERYGRVERIVVDVEGRRVFIRFVEGVSALRAVNALEGRIFNGSAIAARFYDEDKFEEGAYDG